MMWKEGEEEGKHKKDKGKQDMGNEENSGLLNTPNLFSF